MSLTSVEKLYVSPALLRVHPLHGGDSANLLHDLGEHVLHLVQLLVADLILNGNRPHPFLYVHRVCLILHDSVALILALILLFKLLFIPKLNGSRLRFIEYPCMALHLFFLGAAAEGPGR